ncbi:hypothetical protein D3C78_1603310 [compost metagenome]
MAAGIGIGFQGLDQKRDLVDMASVRRRPGAPLCAIDGAEIAVFVSPFIPDGNAIFLEIGNIGIALQEPQEFMDDRAQMQLLGGENRKTLRKVETHLVTENRARARAGAVPAVGAGFHDMPEKIEILFHAFCRRFPDIEGI